jgi:adenine-specific DNA-methyltransferase
MKRLSSRERKSTGSHYTPRVLADFVSEQIIKVFPFKEPESYINVLDPGVGDGELLISMVGKLAGKYPAEKIRVFGFDTNKQALDLAALRIRTTFPFINVRFQCEDFLYYVLNNSTTGNLELFKPSNNESFDIIIANPPYVRTQVLGAPKARSLAKDFNLTGRVDLYHAFVLAIARVLKIGGILGIIISNRFMTTQSGKSIRQSIIEKFKIIHIWDLGDTRLFGAAVLPSVLLLQRKEGAKFREEAKFTSIYSTTAKIPKKKYTNVIESIQDEGIIELFSGEQFHIRQGRLEFDKNVSEVWRLTNDEISAWIEKVKKHTYCNFRDIGRIRVGVKTTADRVFIRSDWEDFPEKEKPELLFPLTTHHNARRYRPKLAKKQTEILYPHQSIGGKRAAIELSDFPKTASYLEKHRDILESRKYVVEAGRKWYEIWVPQNPEAWKQTKLIFWDIAERPTFWIDLTGSIVNGDCYWMVNEKPHDGEMLWLALAVANSTFIEKYYDNLFHNKLYAGRRRFITQYVEKFPLPDPNKYNSQKAIQYAKNIYDIIPSPLESDLENKIDLLVWELFGFSAEEIGG